MLIVKNNAKSVNYLSLKCYLYFLRVIIHSNIPIIMSLVLSSAIVIVIVVMRLEDLLSELLLTLVNICVQLVPVLSDRKLLIIVNWDIDLFGTDGLIIRVVELGYVWVL